MTSPETYGTAGLIQEKLPKSDQQTKEQNDPRETVNTKPKWNKKCGEQSTTIGNDSPETYSMANLVQEKLPNQKSSQQCTCITVMRQTTATSICK